MQGSRQDRSAKYLNLAACGMGSGSAQPFRVGEGTFEVEGRIRARLSRQPNG